MQCYTEVDKEDLYILKINCKGERTVGKANKGINVEKVKISLKKLKLKKEEKKKNKQLPRTAKAQYKGKGL